MATRKPPITPRGVPRSVRSGAQSPGVKSLNPEVFDLDYFMASARDKKVTGALNRNDVKKYNEAVDNLENIIKGGDHKKFDDAEEAVRNLLKTKNTDKKITTLLNELKKLAANVKNAKTRGGDWFQGIKFKDDSPEKPVAVATNVSTDNKSVPKSEQTDVSGKLLDIEKILEDALVEEKGTIKKKSGNRTTDDVLKSIETLCTSAVNYRAKTESADVKTRATAKCQLQAAKEWIISFEKQMKELSLNEAEFKHSLPQCNELDEIREILNRLIQVAKEQEDDRKKLENNNTKLAKELLSLLNDEHNKTGNSKKTATSKEKNINQLLEISISELNKQIDELTNQANRLERVTKSWDATNGELVDDKKTAPIKKSKGRQGKSLPAIIETELKQLEDECGRNKKIVKQLDNEIECLERDIVEWEQSENVKELKDIGKCSLKALRSARINLQKQQREKVQKGKQGDVKKLNETIETLCKNYGIAEPKEKKDKHVGMLTQLDDRLKTEKVNLKTLEKELNELQDRDTKKQNGSKTTQNSTEIQTLITLAQNANKNQERLNKDYEKEQKSKSAFEKNLQHLEDDVQLLYTSIPEEFRKTNQPSSEVVLEEVREFISRQSQNIQSLAEELTELQKELQVLGKDVLVLSEEHEDSLANSAQGTHSLLHTVQIMQKQLQKAVQKRTSLEECLRENNASMQHFSEHIDQPLDFVINILTNKPPDRQSSHENCPECPQILKPTFVKVLQIKRISEQSLASLQQTFEIIIGSDFFQNSVRSNTKGGYKSEQNIIENIEKLVNAAISKRITGENVSNLEAEVQKSVDCRQEVKKLRGEITYWEATAKREENEKLEYMNRLSKVASAKLMDNNPNIADLSDPNRQTKLAEEYSQLYDNEWTNAYEDREEKQPKESEENRIEHLLEILTTVYSTCANFRTQQLTGMKTAILQPAKFFCLLNERPTTEATGSANKKIEGAKETNKKKSAKHAQSKRTSGATKTDSEDVTLGILQSQAITDLGKQTSTQALLDITKYFESSKEIWFNSKNLRKYTAKCIEICWLMNIHSPPVCLDDDIPSGSRFDKAKYREYTARGKKVKFVVWPAILLHENGPTLGKGVAQGMG